MRSKPSRPALGTIVVLGLVAAALVALGVILVMYASSPRYASVPPVPPDLLTLRTVGPPTVVPGRPVTVTMTVRSLAVVHRYGEDDITIDLTYAAGRANGSTAIPRVIQVDPLTFTGSETGEIPVGSLKPGQTRAFRVTIVIPKWQPKSRFACWVGRINIAGGSSRPGQALDLINCSKVARSVPIHKTLRVPVALTKAGFQASFPVGHGDREALTDPELMESVSANDTTNTKTYHTFTSVNRDGSRTCYTFGQPGCYYDSPLYQVDVRSGKNSLKPYFCEHASSTNIEIDGHEAKQYRCTNVTEVIVVRGHRTYRITATAMAMEPTRELGNRFIRSFRFIRRTTAP